MLRQIIFRSVPYGWAAVTVASALGVRMLLHPLLGDNRPFLTFLAAVALAAWFGGRGPALFAIGLSYFVANWLLMPPLGRFTFDYMSATEWVNALTFVGLSSIIVGPILALQNAQRRVEAGATQIAQLLEAAKETERHKDFFLATLAHELRNPLIALTRALELWPIRQHDAADLGELRALMTMEVRQIARFIDDLLDVARIARGAIRLQKDRVDVVTLIEQVIESVRPMVDERGHQLHVDLPADPVFVDADMIRLTQVFLNILDNAIKYTDRNGTIWIVARRQEKDVVVQIRDNGPGIAKSMLATVFEMFSQASSTLVHSAGGLGIGLYLVKQLVALHGGKVEAHSQGPGKGTEFVVTLPAGACEQFATPDASPGQPTR